MKKRLTISIPTYNRIESLRNLLDVLVSSIARYPEGKDLVEIYVSDNNSTDRTAEYFNKNKKFIGYYKHPKNMGAEFNIRHCIKNSNGEYLWIIGDDDIPNEGLIECVLNIILRMKPDLIFVRPKFSNKIDMIAVNTVITANYTFYDQEKFVSKIGHLFTFLSSVIIKNDEKNSFELNTFLDKYQDSHLLALVYSAITIKNGNRFCIIDRPKIYCTSGATNSYPALKTFGVNYPMIVRDILGVDSNLTYLMIKSLLAWHLPGIVWVCRGYNPKYGNLEEFNTVRTLFQGNTYFIILFTIIGIFPKPISWMFYQYFRFYSKIRRLIFDVI